MQAKNLSKELSSKAYPGRGIILGKSPNGRFAVAAYFIMGRSENSRNRVFVEDENGIRTKAADPKKMRDPHLVIYSPVRVWKNRTIITNGNQTDTIYEGFEKGLTFEQSLRSRQFEDDEPHYTPRISSVANISCGKCNFAFSILKSDGGNPKSCNRFTFAYENPAAGKGRFLHTYAESRSGCERLSSFEGEPVLLEIPSDSIEEFADLIWNALNEENKISLWTRFIEIDSGKFESKIINKNQA